MYTLPSYIKSFYTNHPGYELSQGEYNILMAITQLVPRILEESLFRAYASTLTGKDRLVRFVYTRFNKGSLTQPLELGSTRIKVEISNSQGPFQTCASMQEVTNALGVGLKTVQKFINHVSPINSPKCGLVNIQEVGYEGPLLTQPIVHRVEPEYAPMIIPGYAPSNVEPGKVFAFTKDLQPYSGGPYDSLTNAASLLHKPGKTPRGLRNTIARGLNTVQLVDTRAGLLYFVQNPNSPNLFLENHKGLYPCVLLDLETNVEQSFDGLKPIVAHLS